MKTKRFRKSNIVWFIDSDANSTYPEYGKIEAITTSKELVIQSYFGLFLLPKEECYFTKEECQEAIDKALKEGEEYADKT